MIVKEGRREKNDRSGGMMDIREREERSKGREGDLRV
jgi:hypothetical protein